jgi:hypothetical protein
MQNTSVDPKMKWTLRQAGMYWPMMVEDCVRYKMGCEACQKYGEIQSVPTSVLNPIVRPWPFRCGSWTS